MARCDEGYRCDVCGQDVEGIADSDLYLRYVLGEVDPEILHVAPERHLRCNPAVSQFIVEARFQPSVVAEGDFGKAGLDPAFVAEEEARVTAGYRRLIEIAQSRQPMALTEYPLPGVAERWRHEGEDAGSVFDRFNR